jgi:glutamyl-tRNA synthetase
MAHVVDDHLMHTTHVIRSDEWVSSAPIHLELFEAFGWAPPHYCHYSPMLKEENGKKRKISKRKDPEAAVSYYHQIGVPNDAVKEYLMGVANSAFEDWRKENPNTDLHTFPFRLDRMSISGALFDMNKLIDISKNMISSMSPDVLCAEYIAWLEKYDPDTLCMMKDREYMRRIFSIERDEKGTKRKDYYCWSEVRGQMEFLFDECFSPVEYPFQKINDAETLKKVFGAFKEVYAAEDDSSIWFEKMKDIAESIGYARDFKTWKKNKETYDGHVGDVCAAFRVALTGRTNSPDLYSVMQVLGKDRVFVRLDQALRRL